MSEYFLACLRALSNNGLIKITVIHWEINREAPFDFNFPEGVQFIEKRSLKKENLFERVKLSKPDLIICSGWIDKDYLKVCRAYARKIPIVLGMDNVWSGGVKQTIGIILGRILLNRYFEYVWIPGHPQYSYAEKLGFPKEKILLGNYSADYNYFNSLFLQNQKSKKAKFPHKFLYVGRYIESKGIGLLIDAFNQIGSELGDWELWCVGTGELKNRYEENEKVKHLGFIQPKDLGKVIKETGIFILPSEYEPWGVVAHEFAAAGFPLLLSSKVGAATKFIEEGKNGQMFQSNDLEQLTELIKDFINKTDEQLYNMSLESNRIASSITPDKWADTLLALLNKDMV